MAGDMQSSRIGHTKSRNGCLRCKQRKVKCDEQSPCANCIRRNEECSLTSYNSQETSPQSSLSPDPYNFLLLSPGDLPNTSTWAQDLFLMSHYVTSTCPSVGHSQAVTHLWQTYFPEVATTHPFLMHGMLAFSAVHLSRMRPRDSARFEMQSQYHLSLALEGYRAQLPHLDESNYVAVFVMSAILAVLSISTIATKPGPALHEPCPFPDLLAFLSLTHSIKHITATCWGHLATTPLNAMMYEHQIAPHDTPLPPHLIMHFEALRARIAADQDAEAASTCTDCLNQLQAVYQNVLALAPRTFRSGVVVTWLTHVPSDYVNLLRRRHGSALGILGHFVVLWELLPERWFTNNFGPSALRSIAGEMEPEEAQFWLTWPQGILRPEPTQKVEEALGSMEL
ncbi:hypothetical protein EJ06DRAFT_533567 [Trichodelitschia bisporula]|uniref:Zn(2)-C6 fungal-type domain-containing protein n=1 Tax=Trichodelitschia bisporula TaxID=703511 RepID=A0A6G1HLX5_9PEZI|nr:hypothetical protein EJ06DRAFT_533567 [Trichodelitschia bisporula]